MTERDWASTGEPLSQSEAEKVLAAMTADSAKLAESARKPWWHAWVLALAMTVLVGSLVLDQPLRLVALMIALTANAVYGRDLKRRKVVPNEYQKRIVILYILLTVVLLILLGAAFAVHSSDLSNWWGLVPALAAGTASLVVSRREEAIIVEGIAAGTRDRS